MGWGKDVIFAARNQEKLRMATTLQPRQQRQLESFWNLVSASDVDVQRELFVLLSRKYASHNVEKSSVLPLLQMKGRLKAYGDTLTDKQILREHLEEKYGV